SPDEPWTPQGYVSPRDSLGYLQQTSELDNVLDQTDNVAVNGGAIAELDVRSAREYEGGDPRREGRAPVWIRYGAGEHQADPTDSARPIFWSDDPVTDLLVSWSCHLSSGQLVLSPIRSGQLVLSPIFWLDDPVTYIFWSPEPVTCLLVSWSCHVSSGQMILSPSLLVTRSCHPSSGQLVLSPIFWSLYPVTYLLVSWSCHLSSGQLVLSPIRSGQLVLSPIFCAVLADSHIYALSDKPLTVVGGKRRLGNLVSSGQAMKDRSRSLLYQTWDPNLG
ncbi:hypothetical protein BaRGS_00002329, partial [Batillaria attramentaria]